MTLSAQSLTKRFGSAPGYDAVRNASLDLHAGGPQDFDKSIVFLDCSGERRRRAEVQRPPFSGDRFIAPKGFARMLERHPYETSEFGERVRLGWHLVVRLSQIGAGRSDVAASEIIVVGLS